MQSAKSILWETQGQPMGLFNNHNKINKRERKIYRLRETQGANLPIAIYGLHLNPCLKKKPVNHLRWEFEHCLFGDIKD